MLLLFIVDSDYILGIYFVFITGFFVFILCIYY